MDTNLPSPSTPPPTPERSEKATIARDAVADNLHRSDAADDAKAVGVATVAVTPETQAAQTKPGLWGAILETFNKFGDDDVMTQAAALAFYTGISLAPLLTVILWAVQTFTPFEAKDKVQQIAISVVGKAAEEPMNQLLHPPADKTLTVAGIASILFLAFTASGVFAQLQSSLNLIWNVKPDPKKSGIVILIRKRIFSFGMLFTLLFLMLVSMLATVAIYGVLNAIAGEKLTTIASVVNIVITFLLATVIFGWLFKYLPDVRVPWKDTLLGAALTAVLFIVGRFAIGFYISRGGYDTSYGAAIGSFLALLVWVYYTSIILFLGTEATTVYARRHGHDPVPEKHAVRTMRTERILERTQPAGTPLPA